MALPPAIVVAGVGAPAHEALEVRRGRVMGRADVYMRLYVGDYRKDTASLSCEEHGAFLMLLMELWTAGGRVPLDHVRLARAVGAAPKVWRRVWPRISRFFVVEDGHLTNRRLSLELELARTASERASSNARARWASKQPKSANELGRGEASAPPVHATLQAPSHAAGNALHPSSVIRHPDPDPDLRSQASAGVVQLRKPGQRRTTDQDPDFDAWYGAYPRKKARADALKAWRQTAGQRPPIAQMLSKLEEQKAEWARQGRPPDKIAYPASYLRDGCWADEPDRPLTTTTTPAVSAGMRAVNAAAIARYGR